MKSKLVSIAGGFACASVAATSIPAYADGYFPNPFDWESTRKIHSAITGSSLCLGEDEDGFCRASVANTTSKQLIEKEENYNTVISTGVGYSSTTYIPSEAPNCVFNDEVTQGFLFEYDYAPAVSTLVNGDLVYVELDNTRPTSSVCFAPSENRYEVTLYRKITGGTGQFAGACGWVDFQGTGTFLGPDTSFSSIEGTQVGEIFVGDVNCP